MILNAQLFFIPDSNNKMSLSVAIHCITHSYNSLPDNKILVCSKLKGFAFKKKND